MDQRTMNIVTENHARTKTAKIRVQMNAPTKPSTVFLGESLISGVLPKVTPNDVNDN